MQKLVRVLNVRSVWNAYNVSRTRCINDRWPMLQLQFLFHSTTSSHRHRSAERSQLRGENTATLSKIRSRSKHSTPASPLRFFVRPCDLFPRFHWEEIPWRNSQVLHDSMVARRGRKKNCRPVQLNGERDQHPSAGHRKVRFLSRRGSDFQIRRSHETVCTGILFGHDERRRFIGETRKFEAGKIRLGRLSIVLGRSESCRTTLLRIVAKYYANSCTFLKWKERGRVARRGQAVAPDTTTWISRGKGKSKRHRVVANQGTECSPPPLGEPTEPPHCPRSNNAVFVAMWLSSE